MVATRLSGTIMTTDVLAFGPDDGVEQAMRALLDATSSGVPSSTGTAQVSACSPTAISSCRRASLHFPTVMTFLGGTSSSEAQAVRGGVAPSARLEGVRGDVDQEPTRVQRATTRSSDAATLMHEHDVSRLARSSTTRQASSGSCRANDILRAIVSRVRLKHGDGRRGPS